jgi:AraC-like DNA-binding protein
VTSAAETSDQAAPPRYPDAMLTWRIPAPPLSEYVRVLWHADGWMPSNGHERHMPDGTAGVIISLTTSVAGDSDRLGILTGPRSTASLLTGARPQTIIGAQFTTAGATPFVRMPVHELSNQVATLRDVGFANATLLRERLLAAGSADERLRLLESELTEIALRRAGPDAAIAWAVRQIERRPNRRIGDVAAQIGRSSRWFIDRFASDVGFTPKVFARVHRFHLALSRMHGDADCDLADVAAAAGYFDQAHFGHDFRTIAGISPTDYLSGRTTHPNHVAISR